MALLSRMTSIVRASGSDSSLPELRGAGTRSERRVEVGQGQPADDTVRFLLRALPGSPFELVEEVAVVRAREDLHALRGARAVEELAHPLHRQRGIVLGDKVERR